MSLLSAFRGSLGVLALGALTGCAGTLDSLGGGASGGASSSVTPTPLKGPASYPNAFKDLLGKSDAEIANKLNVAFLQLFHGDPDTQAIYFPVGADRAYVQDVLHADIRSEGIALGMIVALELDHQEEFDRLWTYAKASLRRSTGPGRGYFDSVCDDTTPCFDPYGMEQFVSALLFAQGRWGSASKPYGAEALTLLSLLRNKEAENGGVIGDVTNVFDTATALVREQPTLETAGYTRSSLQMPGSYELWAQASGDAFWHGAALAARSQLLASAHPATGLWPMHNYFDGTPVSEPESYRPQAYRTQFNLALDAVWSGGLSAQTALADRVLGFFTAQGVDTYGAIFALDGTVLDPNREQGLIAANGALAVAASRPNRAAFVSAVWSQAIPSGPLRYYDGVLYLMSLLVLSGQYRVY